MVVLDLEKLAALLTVALTVGHILGTLRTGERTDRALVPHLTHQITRERLRTYYDSWTLYH